MACTGAAAGSPSARSAVQAVSAVLSVSLGWPATSVLTAPRPAVAGAPGGAEAAATASAARYEASLSPTTGSASRSEPHPGRFTASSAVGLACRPGNAAQLCWDSASLSCGRTASTTGELTSERASLTLSLPAAACSRAAETELAGIHSAGRSPRSPGQSPMNPDTTASEPPWVTVIFTQRSPTGLAVVLNPSANFLTLSAIDGSTTTGTLAVPPRHCWAALLDRCESTSPKNRHRITPPTTTTTVMSATMTPMLTPRRPPSLRCPPSNAARWRPVAVNPSSPSARGKRPLAGSVGSAGSPNASPGPGMLCLPMRVPNLFRRTERGGVPRQAPVAALYSRRRRCRIGSV